MLQTSYQKPQTLVLTTMMQQLKHMQIIIIEVTATSVMSALNEGGGGYEGGGEGGGENGESYRI